MRISKQLNIVIPVETEKNGKIFVHSTPINRDVFDEYYRELGKVFDECFDVSNSAHTMLSAPQLAYSSLKRVSKESNRWDGNGGVEFGLVNEIKRLTNVAISDENGWSSFPLDVVIKRGLIDEDERIEVLSGLIFFTCISRVAPAEIRTTFLEMAGSLRNWDFTLSDSSGYLSFLKKSTAAETSESKVIA